MEIPSGCLRFFFWRPARQPRRWPDHPRRRRPLKFCVRGRVREVVIYFKFHENRSRDLGAVGGRKSPSPIDKAHGLYNSLYYRTSRACRCDITSLWYMMMRINGWGRLKMREWKLRYGQKCKGGKCRCRLAVWKAAPILYSQTALSYFLIIVLRLPSE